MPNLKNTDKEIDILLKIYEANRAAIITRVGFRDNALMIFLGGVATIFGAAIQTNNYVFLLIIPFLSLGVSAIVSNHQYFIKAHVWHSVNEVGKRIHELGIMTNIWEMSLGDLGKTEKRTRLLGDFLYILTPCFVGIFLNINSQKSNCILISGAVLGTFISFFLLLGAFKYRKKTIQRINEIRSQE